MILNTDPTDFTSQIWMDEEVYECMKQDGFDYEPPDRSTTLESTVAIFPDDLDWREQYGFNVSIPFEEAEAPLDYEDPNATYYEQLAEAERVEYDEARTECGDEAFDAYSRAVDRYLNAMDQADRQVLESLVPDYLEATADDDDWVRCMAADGFAFDTRDRLIASLTSELETVAEDSVALAELQKHERAAAVSDYHCSNIPQALESQEEQIATLVDQAPSGDILGES